MLNLKSLTKNFLRSLSHLSPTNSFTPVQSFACPHKHYSQENRAGKHHLRLYFFYHFSVAGRKRPAYWSLSFEFWSQTPSTHSLNSLSKWTFSCRLFRRWKRKVKIQEKSNQKRQCLHKFISQSFALLVFAKLVQKAWLCISVNNLQRNGLWKSHTENSCMNGKCLMTWKKLFFYFSSSSSSSYRGRLIYLFIGSAVLDTRQLTFYRNLYLKDLKVCDFHYKYLELYTSLQQIFD